MSGNLLKVQPIRNGTVIDHIEAGRGRKILDILELGNSGTTISLLINVQSKKQKRKDIIKVEDRELDENEIEKLALLSPSARVNIIRNYAVADKKIVDIPEFCYRMFTHNWVRSTIQIFIFFFTIRHWLFRIFECCVC